MNNQDKNEFWQGMEELRRQIAKLTDGWGRFVEGSMAPSAVRIFSQLGYKVISDYPSRKVWYNGRVVLETDILIVAKRRDERFLFVGEAKSFCSSKDVEEFKTTLKGVRKYLEEYKDYKIIGFIGGMGYGKGADVSAVKEGIYVLKPSGEAMVLDVPSGFEPKNF